MGGHRRAAENERERAPTEVRRPVSAAPMPRPVGTAVGMLALQRTIGNRAAYRLATGAVQTKLQVGPAGDHFEREADQVADEVMRHLTPTTVTSDEEGNLVSRSVDDGVVGLEGGPLASETESAIQRTRGRGTGLPASLRRSMEAAFGADFGGVRVHTGPSADGLNHSMQSRAFTVGSDVFFARGQYQPGSTSGQRLLAHELTHTVQQGAAPAAAETSADEPGAVTAPRSPR